MAMSRCSTFPRIPSRRTCSPCLMCCSMPWGASTTSSAEHARSSGVASATLSGLGRQRSRVAQLRSRLYQRRPIDRAPRGMSHGMMAASVFCISRQLPFYGSVGRARLRDDSLSTSRLSCVSSSLLGCVEPTRAQVSRTHPFLSRDGAELGRSDLCLTIHFWWMEQFAPRSVSQCPNSLSSRAHVFRPPPFPIPKLCRIGRSGLVDLPARLGAH
mmetsp:Transcript_57317/g.185683  ORF Transcript_57317/g.185683 Transcript_57317/m.185683 type:complete len:214 (-) Transcript_57317:127-768(-)